MVVGGYRGTPEPSEATGGTTGKRKLIGDEGGGDGRDSTVSRNTFRWDASHVNAGANENYSPTTAATPGNATT